MNVWLVYELVREDEYRWREEAYVKCLSVSEKGPQVAYELPVLLGQVSRTSSDGSYQYQTLTSGRSYTEMVGEMLLASSGQGRIQISNEFPDEPVRFAITVPDESDGCSDAWTIDREGKTFIKGPVELNGDLLIASSQPQPKSKNRSQEVDKTTGKTEVTPAIKFEELDAPFTEAAPWQIYRVTEIENKDTPNQAIYHQLRAEIENPGKKGAPQRFQFVIGVDSQETGELQFAPCLTVRSDGTVVMHGNVEIEDGHVVESPIDADPQDIRFNSLVIDSFTQSQSAAASQANATYAAAMNIQFAKNPLPAETIEELEYTVSIQNISDVFIPNVQIFELITLRDVSGPQDQVRYRYYSGVNQVLDPGIDRPPSVPPSFPLNIPVLEPGKSIDRPITKGMVIRPPLKINENVKPTLIVMVKGTGPGVFPLASAEAVLAIGPAKSDET
jgi:hypothetical protein